MVITNQNKLFLVTPDLNINMFIMNPITCIATSYEQTQVQTKNSSSLGMHRAPKYSIIVYSFCYYENYICVSVMGGQWKQFDLEIEGGVF